MYKATISVTLRPSILDSQGKATHDSLKSLGFETVDSVRIGKHIEMWIDETDEDKARSLTDASCQKLLASPVMEDYTFELEKVG